MRIGEEIRGHGKKLISGRQQLAMTPSQSRDSVAAYRERRRARRRTDTGLQAALPRCDKSRRNRNGWLARQKALPREHGVLVRMTDVRTLRLGHDPTHNGLIGTPRHAVNLMSRHSAPPMRLVDAKPHVPGFVGLAFLALRLANLVIRSV